MHKKDNSRDANNYGLFYNKIKKIRFFWFKSDFFLLKSDFFYLNQFFFKFSIYWNLNYIWSSIYLSYFYFDQSIEWVINWQNIELSCKEHKVEQQ